MYYIKSDFFCCFQTFKDLLGFLLQSLPFYRAAKVILPIIMTKTFCKILTNFIMLFLRTFRLFISGLQIYRQILTHQN